MIEVSIVLILLLSLNEETRTCWKKKFEAQQKDKPTIFQNSKKIKTFVSWSSSLISKKRNFDSVTANSLVY